MKPRHAANAPLAAELDDLVRRAEDRVRATPPRWVPGPPHAPPWHLRGTPADRSRRQASRRGRRR